MIHAVVFDLVGVLVHLNRRKLLLRLGIWTILTYVIRYRKNPITECFNLLDAMRTRMPGEFQETIHFQGMYLPDSFCQFQRGKISSDECLQKVYDFFDEVNHQGYFTSSHQAEVMKHIATTMFKPSVSFEALELNHHVLDVIKHVRSNNICNVYLFSNIDAEALTFIGKKFPDLFDYFDGVIASYQVGYVKPEEEIYHILYDTYNVDPTKAVYVDDQHDNVAMGQTHGMRSIHYQRPQDLEALKTLLKQ